MTLLQILESAVSALLSAGITFFVGFIIARFAKKLTKIFLHEVEVDIFFRKMNYTFSAEEFLSKAVELLIYAGTIAIILNQFGILNWVLFLTLISVLIVLLTASILNLKEAVPNFIARLQITNLSVGDKITVNSLAGRIEDIGFFQTKILSKNNEVFWIPNVVVKKYVK